MLLTSLAYQLDSEHKIWLHKNYAGISYSDGDAEENHIKSIIDHAMDVSVLSPELAGHCTDWPTLYHLSRKRANVLRTFEEDLRDKEVLEIGAGCGAITRYLGEIGANVLALEGSPRRASIAAARCRGLDNVTVVAEAFHLLSPMRQFDVVTLIGVLEYARQFFPAEQGDPIDAMLAHAKGFLRPGGKLIIAIENQLGLKYFAGFPEDHALKPMFGIEEHYTKGSVATFGRRELGERAAKAGLHAQQWWYPFPDYKLPSLLVSEMGAVPRHGVDLTPVVRSACIGDPQYPTSVCINQERAWRPIIRNGLLGEMANSFILLASDSDFTQNTNLPLAVHYATDRRPEFAKKVVFDQVTNGGVVTRQVPLYPSARTNENSVLEQRLVDQPFVRGELWQDRLVQIVTTPGWSVEHVYEWFGVWLDSFCVHSGIDLRKHGGNAPVDGRFYDLIPLNMFVDENGDSIFIDQEWVYPQALDFDYLVFRALYASFVSVGTVSAPRNDVYLHLLPLIVDVARCSGFEFTEAKVSKFLELEGKIQFSVVGRACPSYSELASWMFRESDTQSSPLIKIAKLNQVLAERDGQIASLNKTVAAMLGSSSWRATAPLRAFSDWLRQLSAGRKGDYRSFGAVASRLTSLSSRWLNRGQYLFDRYRQGVIRHGFLRSFPLGIRAFYVLFSAWFKKLLRRKEYEQRLTDLATMIVGHRGFIDLFHVPMGWSTPLFQRFQHMSLQASRLGGLALYGGHPQVDRDVFVFKCAEGNVVVFDAYDPRVVACIFDSLRLTVQKKILRLQSIDLVTRLEDVERFISDGITVVYEYIDAISDEITGAIPEFVIERHRELLRDERVLVVATSDALFEEVRQHRSGNCLLSTNGVDLDHWSKAREVPPADLAAVVQTGRTVIGYHGALANWIDYELLRQIADDGNYEIVLIGYEHDASFAESRLAHHPRVHFIGSKSYFVLNEYAAFYDIGILPFKRNALTDAVSPVKLFEYMAAGKPVVTTDLGECSKYESCFVSKSHDAFLKHLRIAAAAKEDKTYMAALASDAEQNSWRGKAAAMYDLAGVPFVRDVIPTLSEEKITTIRREND
jgi:glycosyltransferase involved in cell wall biosynthesis/SAM-dependent methyltransferase